MPLGTWPTSSIVLVAAALLAACGAIASDDEEDAPPGGCAPLPEDIFVSGPKDGHYVRDRLRVRVGGEGVPTVTSLSLERDGDEVEGSWEPAGSSGWEFLPSDALTPATTYAWAVESSAGCVDGSFTTSPAGAPVEAPAALVGRTFDVSVSTRSDWVGILLSNQWAPVFGPTPRSLFRLRVDGLEEATATATLALNTRSFDGPAQDMCRTTTTMEGSWDGSSLRFDGDSLEVPVGQGSYSGFPGDLTPDPSVVVELRNWSLELVIHPDGDAATLDSMSFDVDTRDLIYFVVPSSCPSAGDGTPLNFCRGLESFGVACTACSDGLETCVDGLFAGAAAPLADDLVDVEADQRENHLCADACDNAIDDDEDGDQDTDEECEPAAWP